MLEHHLMSLYLLTIYTYAKIELFCNSCHQLLSIYINEKCCKHYAVYLAEMKKDLGISHFMLFSKVAEVR